MRALHATVSSFAVFALMACAGLQVQTDYDPEVPLTEFSTYDWVDQEVVASGDPALDSPLLKRHIRDAVEGELARMGYRKVTSDPPELQGGGEGELGRTGYPKATSNNPDLRIAYSVILEERSRIDGYGYGSYGFGGSYGYPRSSYGGSFGFSLFGGRYLRPYYSSYYGYPGAGYPGAGRVRKHLEGTLVLDITDVRTDQVIFRGWARKSVHSDPSPEKVRTYVTEAVEEILEDLPPAGVHGGSRPDPLYKAVER